MVGTDEKEDKRIKSSFALSGWLLSGDGWASAVTIMHTR